MGHVPLPNKQINKLICQIKENILILHIAKDVTKDVTIELTERQRILINLIRDNRTITIPEMSGKAAATERTIQRDLQYLQQLGLLCRIGGRKEGHWEVIHPNE